MVLLKVVNDYECGRHSESEVFVLAPRSLSETDLEAWWETSAWDETGDGHPCGATEGSCYEVTVLWAPLFDELVGQSREWC